MRGEVCGGSGGEFGGGSGGIGSGSGGGEGEGEGGGVGDESGGGASGEGNDSRTLAFGKFSCNFSWRGAEISFFPQPLLKLLKVGLQSLQMGSVAPMKSPYVT
jgi:hypothetical protein